MPFTTVAVGPQPTFNDLHLEHFESQEEHIILRRLLCPWGWTSYAKEHLLTNISVLSLPLHFLTGEAAKKKKYAVEMAPLGPCSVSWWNVSVRAELPWLGEAWPLSCHKWRPLRCLSSGSLQKNKIIWQRFLLFALPKKEKNALLQL